jgi:hypothetical protein
MFKYGGQSAAPIFREIVDRVMANPDYPLARRAKDAEAAPDTSIALTDAPSYRTADAKQTVSGNDRSMKADGQAEMVLAQAPKLLGSATTQASKVPAQSGKTQPGKSPSQAAKSVATSRIADTVKVSSTSPDARVMPDLNNNTLRDALLKLKSLGLDVEYTGTGRIIRQEPATGTPVKAGQKCVLTLGWMG